jgi:hypothetical protein
MTATGSQEVHSLAFVTLVCRCVHARRPTMSIGHSVWPISSRMLMSTSRPGTADVPRQTDSIEVFRQKTTLRRFQQHPRWVTTMVATPWPCAEAPDPRTTMVHQYTAVCCRRRRLQATGHLVDRRPLPDVMATRSAAQDHAQEGC